MGGNCAYGGVKYTSASGVEYVCNGAPGTAGPVGPPGASGSVMAFGFFYALMPPDNASTIAAAGAVVFPRDGAATGIIRANGTDFLLPAIGVYEVSWQVSVDEPGQLVLAIDSGSGAVEQPSTLAGRATGTSQISNHVLITTTAANSVLSLRNPAGNSPALTVTPLAGGTHAVAASLLIKRVQ
mgnify:CR=1 FL=1